MDVKAVINQVKGVLSVAFKLSAVRAAQKFCADKNIADNNLGRYPSNDYKG